MRPLRHLLAALLLTSAALAGPAPQAPFGLDLANHPIAQLASPGTRAVVLLFLATDCPVSNRYLPAIRQLQSQFAPQHVAFWIVYPNPADTPAAIRQHDTAFGPLDHEIRDPQESLVRLARAHITPEAAILLPQASTLREVYRGRIDNRYLSFGVQRPSAPRHDLADALTAVLAHRPVPLPDGPPVGCAIVPQS
jgi:hypothetical protein